MDIGSIIAGAGILAGGFVLPIRFLFTGQTKMKSDVTDLERRTVSRTEVERLITLYTDPIKNDIHATKTGVEGLIEKFHRLELLIAAEFGRNNEVKQKDL